MNARENAFLKSVVPAAQYAQRTVGVPASVTIAQAILESGWGDSALAKQCFNYFGIKAVMGTGPDDYREFLTSEFVDGRKVRELARFRKFPSPAIGFSTHAALLAMTPRYKPAMAVKRDPAAFCRELQICGYSTNPHYADLLMQLIDEFDLTQYDITPPPAEAAEAVA